MFSLPYPTFRPWLTFDNLEWRLQPCFTMCAINNRYVVNSNRCGVKFVCVVSSDWSRGGARARLVHREWSKRFVDSLSAHASSASGRTPRQTGTTLVDCHSHISFVSFYWLTSLMVYLKFCLEFIFEHKFWCYELRCTVILYFYVCFVLFCLLSSS